MRCRHLVLALALGAVVARSREILHGRRTLLSSSESRDPISMAVMALGTWQLGDDEVDEEISAGFAAGYTHVDTANDYGNQVGMARVN